MKSTFHAIYMESFIWKHKNRNSNSKSLEDFFGVMAVLYFQSAFRILARFYRLLIWNASKLVRITAIKTN